MRRSSVTESSGRKGEANPSVGGRIFAFSWALLFATVGLVSFAGTVEAEEYEDCGFFFCEPEPWMSWQNAIHFTSTYALHVTATGMNDSPWLNFLWISALGAGIEVFQGAFLEHPLRGGFSYKNVVFNELGLVTAVAVHKLLLDQAPDDKRPSYGNALSRPSPPTGITGLPLARYLESCDCRRAHFLEGSSPAVHYPRPGLAGLLRTGFESRRHLENRRILRTPQETGAGR